MLSQLPLTYFFRLPSSFVPLPFSFVLPLFSSSLPAVFFVLLFFLLPSYSPPFYSFLLLLFVSPTLVYALPRQLLFFLVLHFLGNRRLLQAFLLDDDWKDVAAAHVVDHGMSA